MFGKHFLTWLVANLIGFAVLAVAYFVLPMGILGAGFAAALLIIALVMGTAQWLALRRLLSISPLWLLSTLLGGALGWLALFNLPQAFWQLLGDDESILALSAGYFVVGLAIGVLQWLLLRLRLKRAWLWILASALGAGLALAVILATELIYRSALLSFCVAALIYATLTGLTLAGLLAYKDALRSGEGFNR
ncbi:MAG: hypothetical protein JW862_00235 [Anaerolineales bacterium]|nr:hypothetical protein [Anaerolineales bacterium]